MPVQPPDCRPGHCIKTTAPAPPTSFNGIMVFASSATPAATVAGVNSPSTQATAVALRNIGLRLPSSARRTAARGHSQITNLWRKRDR
jgi:hypothetical protein